MKRIKILFFSFVIVVLYFLTGITGYADYIKFDYNAYINNIGDELRCNYSLTNGSLGISDVTFLASPEGISVVYEGDYSSHELVIFPGGGEFGYYYPSTRAHNHTVNGTSISYDNVDFNSMIKGFSNGCPSSFYISDSSNPTVQYDASFSYPTDGNVEASYSMTSSKKTPSSNSGTSNSGTGQNNGQGQGQSESGIGTNNGNGSGSGQNGTQEPEREDVNLDAAPNVSKSNINPGEQTCSSLLGDPGTPGTPAYYLNKVFSIMRYVAIILLVVLSVLDFVGAVSAQDDDAMQKAVKKAVKRFIYCIIIFLLPFLIEWILSIMYDTQMRLCIKK